MESNINWSFYFDAIYCIHFLPQKERFKFIKNELSRIGIYQSGIFRFKYTYKTVFDSYIKNSIPHEHTEFESNRSELVMNLLLAYYQIFKECLGLGYKRVVVLENDIVFNKDLTLLYESLEALPLNWDYIHFDKVLNKNYKNKIVCSEKINNYYYKYNGGYWGTGFTAFSNKAMIKFCGIIEKKLYPADIVLENRIPDEGSELNRYVPVYNLCHQLGLDNYYTKIYV